MAAPSHYTDQEWQQARNLVATGMVIREVAERTGISYDALRQRISREDWFVPATALAEAKEVLAQAAQNKQTTNGNAQSLTDGSSQNVTMGVEMAESIAEYGQKGALLVARGMLPVLQRTMKEGSTLLTKEIEDWKTFSSAFATYAKATMLDKPMVAIQNNVWSGDLGSHSAIAADETGQDTDELDLETADGP